MTKDFCLPSIVYGSWLYKYSFSAFYFGFLNKGERSWRLPDKNISVATGSEPEAVGKRSWVPYRERKDSIL